VGSLTKETHDTVLLRLRHPTICLSNEGRWTNSRCGLSKCSLELSHDVSILHENHDAGAVGSVLQKMLHDKFSTTLYLWVSGTVLYQLFDSLVKCSHSISTSELGIRAWVAFRLSMHFLLQITETGLKAMGAQELGSATEHQRVPKVPKEGKARALSAIAVSIGRGLLPAGLHPTSLSNDQLVMLNLFRVSLVKSSMRAEFLQ
jgi:hypothetical protein